MTFFGANISSKAQIRGVVDRLQAANRQSVIREPLLIMTDQEGGLVRRIPGSPVLSEAQIGASGEVTRLGEQAGTNAGNNIRGAGSTSTSLRCSGCSASPATSSTSSSAPTR